MEVKQSPIKLMAVIIKKISHKIKSLFIKKSEVSEKKEVNFKSFKILLFGGIIIFVLITFLLPNEQEIEFTEKIVHTESTAKSDDESKSVNLNSNTATQVWSSTPSNSFRNIGTGSGSQINYNTSMIVGSKSGNAKNQLRAGIRIPLRILDKFIVSQESVPILAESILSTITDSGLSLPAGTRFYGEASFSKRQ